jgi:hypothetical protein
LVNFALDIFEGRGFNGLTALIAGLALLVAVVAAFYARGALFPPKRRLSVHALTPAPLLNDPGPQLATLQVSMLGEVLPNPHVITVIIRNTGRHAVSSAQYDQARPMRLEFGAPIESILPSTSKQGVESLSINGTALLYGPELIRRKQEIAIQVLTSDTPKLGQVVSDHLIDTEVQYKSGGYERQKTWSTMDTISAAGAADCAHADCYRTGLAQRGRSAIELHGAR